MRRPLAAAAIAAVFAACGSSGPQEPSRSERSDVTIVRSGSLVKAGRVGAAAAFRVQLDRAVGPIQLKLTFLDEGGDKVGETGESLPYCGPRATCWWGTTFFSEDYGGTSVRRVRVEVIDSTPYEGDDTVDAFDAVRTSDGVINAEPPGTQGLAYVIATEDGEPRWGATINVSPETGNDIGIPDDVMPRFDNEELQGYFYKGDFQAGRL